MGPERRSRVISEREKRATAYHEAGHALAAHLLEHADPVHKITIVPRGRAMGYVMQFADEERLSAGRAELLDRIGVALAGRVVEELVLVDVTTGAQNDFEQATDLARRMVTRWGMSDRLGPIALAGADSGYLGESEGPRAYSEATARRIDAEIKAIVDEQYQRVRELLAARATSSTCRRGAAEARDAPSRRVRSAHAGRVARRAASRSPIRPSPPSRKPPSAGDGAPLPTTATRPGMVPKPG